MTRFDDVDPGLELPPLVLAPSRVDLVRYAAASGDFNPLHFDPDDPLAQELGDNIVHGRLKFAALGRLLSDWLGRHGRIVSIACEYRGIDMRGAAFTCRGRVTAKDETGRTAELELWVEDHGGRRTTAGSATVNFAITEETTT